MTFADVSEGGPSKLELLEFLQNCDISPASRVSSTFSSRAPSPSPSLMSIMYPGVRPPSGKNSIPASPLSTPLLRSKPPPPPLQPPLQTNLFQPIGSISHSDSNVSIGEATVHKESKDFAVNAEPSSPAPADGKTAAVLKKDPKLGLVLKKQGTDEGDKVGERKPPALSREKKLNRVDSEGTIHQRSRSNEIDYVSLRSDSLKSSHLSAFRSPPASSTQTFSALGYSSAQTPRAMVSPVSVGTDRQSCSSVVSDATAGEELSHSEHRAPQKAADDSHHDENEDDADDDDDDILGKRTDSSQNEGRYSWLKDFDSSLWSNYFTSAEESHFSDC